MRGPAALIFIALFLIFLILKGVGLLWKAGRAALDGDLSKFLDALSSADAKRVRTARGYILQKLNIPENSTLIWSSKAGPVRYALGYAFVWASGLWAADANATDRLKRSKRFLQSVFNESQQDLWVLAGAFAEAEDEQFCLGLQQGYDDFLRLSEVT